jgi:hypothetical protein
VGLDEALENNNNNNNNNNNINKAENEPFEIDKLE